MILLQKWNKKDASKVQLYHFFPQTKIWVSVRIAFRNSEQHYKEKGEAYLSRASAPEVDRDLKMNADVRTSYYLHGKDTHPENLGKVVRTETEEKSSGSPSITNIIDFRPLFNRLFHGDQESDYDTAYSGYENPLPELSPSYNAEQ